MECRPLGYNVVTYAFGERLTDYALWITRVTIRAHVFDIWRSVRGWAGDGGQFRYRVYTLFSTSCQIARRNWRSRTQSRHIHNPWRAIRIVSSRDDCHDCDADLRNVES